MPHGDHRIFATHPLPPIGERGYQSRNDRLRQIAARIRAARLQGPSIPIVLAGNLNLIPWSSLFAKLAHDSGLRRAGIDRRPDPTWYLWPSFAFGLLLIHALFSPGLVCTERGIGLDIGSDHRPGTFTMKRR